MLHTAGAHLPVLMASHVAISHCGTTKFLSTQHYLTAHVGRSNYSIMLSTVGNIFSNTSILKRCDVSMQVCTFPLQLRKMYPASQLKFHTDTQQSYMYMFVMYTHTYQLIDIDGYRYRCRQRYQLLHTDMLRKNSFFPQLIISCQHVRQKSSIFVVCGKQMSHALSQ